MDLRCRIFYIGHFCFWFKVYRPTHISIYQKYVSQTDNIIFNKYEQPNTALKILKKKKKTHLLFLLVNLFKVRLDILCVALLLVGSSSPGKRLHQDQRQC